MPKPKTSATWDEATGSSSTGRAVAASGSHAGTSARVSAKSATRRTGPNKLSAAAAKQTAGRDATARKAAAKAPAKAATARKAAGKAPAKAATAKKAAAKAPAKAATAKKAAAKAPAKSAAAKDSTAKTGSSRTGQRKTASRPRATADGATAGGSRSTARATGQPRPSRSRSRLPVLEGEAPWTAAERSQVFAELQADRERLLAEVSSAEHDIAVLLRDGGDGAGNDQADIGSNALERDAEMSLAHNSREMLFQVERALVRLDDGTFGVCESCGRPIGKLRVMAFPRATLCLPCKQRQERR